jgi:hypothetical protein
MLYEMRTYIIPAGRMHDILERFESATFRLFEKYDMEVLGFWTVSKPADKYALVYLMRFADEDAKEQAWTAFRADREWIATRERTEANGPIVEEVISESLLPTSFSPLQ